MTISLYDTAARAVRPFEPLRPGEVSIYLCGATVQAHPHIGHIRSGVVFDVIGRWFERRGFAVTLVRNVTDIDDKIIAGADAEGIPFWRLAMRNERAFSWAYDVLGCTPPAAEPRATGHVTEMVVLMQRLIDAGHAYAAGGDVYFDVVSYRDYGALSGQRVDEMQPAGDTASNDAKRDPRDFALWKSAKPGEPSWPTPWGEGRPGWHLECSAMAHRYLGPAFDIHGGGLDLVFPHHENEIAQSKAAGDAFATYWLHNYWVTTSGEKMSKSLGNSLLVSEVVRRVRPIELRYYLVAPHYRSHIEFSEAALHEAAAGFGRIESFVRHAAERVGVGDPGTVTCADFEAAMDSDFGTPAAVAALHQVVRDGNKALDAGDDVATRGALASVRSMLDVLGLDPLSEPWASRSASGADRRLHDALDAVVTAQLEARAAARAAKDFATADAIRDTLAAAGIAIDDTAHGARWSLSEER